MATGHTYAGKIVSKKLLTKSNQEEKMTQEINIHRSLNHKHIVGFQASFEDNEFVYVVLELCQKRSIMELHKRRKALTEPETRYYMKQILDGVLYLHDNGIIHSDLNLTNLFLNDDIEVKIGGFGLATKIEYEGQRNNIYLAPEAISMDGVKADVWSIGSIMYTLLVGKPPYESNSLRETYERIKRCDYNIPTEIKAPAANLIYSMLLPDPKKRPTVEEIISSDFFNDYIPSKLPVSCLSVAPRFDSNPLAEVNNGGENSPALVKANAGTGDVENKAVGITATTGECKDHLRMLHTQLKKVLECKPSHCQREAEELADPDARPFVWISNWVDYSDKYGFGYQLCDDGVGIMFNDKTRIVLLADQKNVHYIERDGTENYYTMDNTPPALAKKVKLLSYFRRYIKEHLMKAGASIQVQESDSLSRIPYLLTWHRTPSTVIMQLTNGTVQMNFNDHTKIILCPLLESVTYIDTEKNFRTYRFSTIMKNGCSPGLSTCLDYAAKKIENLLRSQ